MAKDISSEHYADVQKIGRDRAEREKIKQKQERAAARVARQPEAVKKIDLQLQRIEFLKMAAQITVGAGRTIYEVRGDCRVSGAYHREVV